MSDKSDGKGVRLLPGAPMPTPPYHYQTVGGKGGSVSVQKQQQTEKKFTELRNFVLATD